MVGIINPGTSCKSVKVIQCDSVVNCDLFVGTVEVLEEEEDSEVKGDEEESISIEGPTQTAATILDLAGTKFL